jgi:hypothetical protein
MLFIEQNSLCLLFGCCGAVNDFVWDHHCNILLVALVCGNEILVKS